VRMSRLAFCRIVVFCMLPASCLPAAAQTLDVKGLDPTGLDLKGKVELTNSGHHVRDDSKTVVWLTPLSNMPIEAARPQKASEIPKLTQKNKSFQPSLLVIPVGGKVEFPNQDPFFHNVFSLFEGKRFDLGLYESGTTRFVQFDKPGISYIFCNIHAQMSAVIIAVDTPHYAMSDVHGEVVLHEVLPGRYQMHVFHPAVSPEVLRAAEREITVSPGETFLGTISLAESSLEVAHKNKYGRDYDPPDPENPAYARP
jgi:plastocyanin